MAKVMDAEKWHAFRDRAHELWHDAVVLSTQVESRRDVGIAAVQHACHAILYQAQEHGLSYGHAITGIATTIGIALGCAEDPADALDAVIEQIKIAIREQISLSAAGRS